MHWGGRFGFYSRSGDMGCAHGARASEGFKWAGRTSDDAPNTAVMLAHVGYIIYS